MNVLPPVWVLLRGLAREAGHWGGFLQRLEAALPQGARVLAIDTPGNGSRRNEPVPLSLSGSVAVVREELEALAPAAQRGPTRIFAMSMGGMIALEWAKLHGTELAGVVVGNSSVGNLSLPWERLRPSAWPTVLGGFFEKDLARRETSILEIVANDAQARGSVQPAWVDLAKERSTGAASARNQILAATRFRAPKAPLGCPLLVLSGEKDRLCAPACSRKIAAYYGAPLETHPSAGHELAIDAPEWLITHLLSFGARHQSTV